MRGEGREGSMGSQTSSTLIFRGFLSNLPVDFFARKSVAENSKLSLNLAVPLTTRFCGVGHDTGGH